MNDHNRDPTEAALGLLGLSPTNSFPPSLVPFKRKRSPVIAHNSDDITCICGFSYDDGFSIACDDCSRWCHAACFDIMEGEVPEEFRCWECAPRPVDKERAVKLQRARLKHVDPAQPELERVRRRVSPGVERKQRRASTAAVVPAAPAPVTTSAVAHNADNSKRKRRPSIHDESLTAIDVDEPWALSYVHIPRDILPHPDTREKLRRQAQHWRGITALDDQLSRTTVRPLPPSSSSSPALSLYTNPSVRPPSYAIHTSTSVASDELITPYTSTITPSASYLSDPLNSYAHLGMPKPFVHLIGPPLDLALDSRVAGNTARFVRNGCRPNATLRPFLCPQSKQSPQTLSFGVFALRDLKANEEVVLGWEWDDGHVIHNLPALIEDPHAFPGASPDDNTLSPEKLHHIRNQMSNILHVLSSTFTTCACGARARNCAIAQMAAFVDGGVVQSPGERIDLGPLVGARRGFRTKEKVPFSGGLSGVEMCNGMDDNGIDSRASWDSTSNLTLSGSPTTIRLQDSSNLSSKDEPLLSPGLDRHDANVALMRAARIHCPPEHRNPQTLDAPAEPCHIQVDVVTSEDKMPPKMRKKWIHRESEVLRESSNRCPESPSTSDVSLGGFASSRGVGLGIRMENDTEVEDLQSMPPPPKPPSQTPETPSATSPSTSFARLSLVSPIMTGTLDALACSSNFPWMPLSRMPHSTTSDTGQSTVLQHTIMPDTEAEVDLHCLPAPAESQLIDCAKPREADLRLPLIIVSTAETASPSPGEIPVLPCTTSPTVVESCTTQESDEGLTLSTKENAPSDSEAITNGYCSNDIPQLLIPSSPPTTSEISAADSRHGTPKVKMSLKDFAIRKRKQREEERTRNTNTNASKPVESKDERMDVDVPTRYDDVSNDGKAGNKHVDDWEGNEGNELGNSWNESHRAAAENRHEEQTEKTGQLASCLVDAPIYHATSSLPSPFQPAVHTRQTKQELIEPPAFPTFDSSRSSHTVTEEPRRASTSYPIHLVGPSRQPQLSHEDGEISSANDGALPSHTTTLPSQPRPTCFHRSHTPPTQPRSFNVTPGTLSPSPPGSSITSGTPRRRSLPPYRSSLPPPSPTSGSSQTASFIAPSPRPLPSGPRALRAMNVPLSSSYRSYPSPQLIPRGPSADRDRLDWERERAWQRPRVRGPGYGR